MKHRIREGSTGRCVSMGGCDCVAFFFLSFSNYILSGAKQVDSIFEDLFCTEKVSSL